MKCDRCGKEAGQNIAMARVLGRISEQADRAGVLRTKTVDLTSSLCPDCITEYKAWLDDREAVVI